MFDPDKLYLTPDDALRTIAPASTMAHWRSEHRGPPYIKIGPKVAYKGSDLIAWLDAQRIEPAAA